MQNFSHIFIRRPVLSIVVNLAIILFGAIGFGFLGVREYPSIDPPVITVKTSYVGANSDIVESQITEPLEKAINGIEGIRSLSSTSSQGNSNITIEFDISANMEKAANDVRDKVSQTVRQLPKDIDGLPTVTKSDASSDAIIAMTVRSDSRNHMEISDYAENVLAQRLITIPGVSTIQVWGQKKYSMRIWMDPAKLAAFALAPLDVQNAITRENVELPAGKISGDNIEMTIVTSGKLKDPEEFNKLIIRNDNERTIRLEDIGYAELGPENEETVLRESNVPMIGLGVVPQPGSNYMDISEEFYKRFEQIKKELPADYSLNIALDNTRFIKLSVTEVGETILIAIVLVIIIIFLFFRDWAVAFRPLIDIPVSLVGAFFLMYLFGFSVNVLTLLAIVLATGLVVDDGIVVTENIYKKVEAGMSPMEAALKGSTEIFFAVISTSVTLAVVFLPVMFMQGFVGRLFREFGMVIAGAVLISAFVSLTLTPMLNAFLIRKNQKKSRFYERTEPFFKRLENAYRNSLAKFMKARWMAFVILGASIVFGIIAWLSLPTELSPLEDRSWLRIQVTTPEGSSFEYTDNFMKKLAQFINDSVPEKKVCLTVTAPGFTGSGAVNSGMVRLVLKDPDQRDRTQQQIADYLNRMTATFPDARAFVIQEQSISTGGGGGPKGTQPVQMVIKAPNFEKLKEMLPKFMDEVRKSSIVTNADANLKFNRPEVSVEIDREKASALGLSVADVAQTMQLAYSGQRFGYFSMNGKQYQVIGQVGRHDRDDPKDLSAVFVRNNKGELIQLDNVIKSVEQSNPSQLYHYNRYMSATVSAGVAPGKTIGDGIEEMQKIAKEVLDDSFSTSLTGASRDFSESSSSTLFAFLLAIGLIFLVLAAQFESFTDPLIIMSTILLGFSAATISLWYFNQTWNIFSQIGLIMLIGLVVKNGILIVEFANQLKEQGKTKMEAIHEASAMRLRPILMTSIATALGAFPIAFALGAGSKSRTGMGVVIVGGVLLSMVLTLYVIPAIYSFFSRSKNHHDQVKTNSPVNSDEKI